MSSPGERIVIVKLLIPKGTLVRYEMRVNCEDDYWRDLKKPVRNEKAKMRAASARVLDMEVEVRDSWGRRTGWKKYRGHNHSVDTGNTCGRSINYRVGKTVTPHLFDTTDTPCAGGIHFFVERSRAEHYS